MNEEVICDLLDLEYQRGLVVGVCCVDGCDDKAKFVVSDWLDFLVDLSDKYNLEMDSVYVNGDGDCFRRGVDVVDEINYGLVEEMCFGVYLDLREFLIVLGS